MLLTIENILTPSELQAARRWLDAAAWSGGHFTAGAQAALVKNNLQLPEGTPGLNEHRQWVLQALSRSALFFTAALPLKIAPPSFNRYAGASNAYGTHADSAIRMQAGTALRSDISATLFLTEPEDYDGGVLTIEDTFGQHGIKLKAGSLVVYPSSSLHSASPVTRGHRTSCFMFIQSMVRDPGQRRLLYDMDMALLELRAEHGETDPVIALTSTYQNLLRRWAES